jgi:hypothetical protein
MLTKDELLQKGISPEVADEIVASFEDSDDNSLQALEKAINGEQMDSLFKAKEGKDANESNEKEEEEDEDEGKKGYSEEYMKKHMKRYMKENKATCGKMMKEVDETKEEMKKAADDIDPDADGSIVEMVDLKPYLETQNEFAETMAKAIKMLSSRIETVAALHEQSYDLMQKAAKVQVEQAKCLGDFMSTPQGRKGIVAPMAKAGVIQIAPEARKAVYEVLMKATQSGNKDAGLVISAFEAHGQDVNKLNPAQKKFVADLLQKEAK